MNLFIYVEGQEEELFVNRVLRGHLSQFGVVVQKPILAATSLRIGGDTDPDITVGGVTNYHSIREDILNLFATGDISAADVLTTFIDLYALLGHFQVTRQRRPAAWPAAERPNTLSRNGKRTSVARISSPISRCMNSRRSFSRVRRRSKTFIPSTPTKSSNSVRNASLFIRPKTSMM